jgi:hypothetical protein
VRHNGFELDWAPALPCPKGCNLSGESSLRLTSTCWFMTKDAGQASTECVVCNHNWAWDFKPDVPFEHQSIFLRANPKKKTSPK